LDAQEKRDLVIHEKFDVLGLREKCIIDICNRKGSSYFLEKEMMCYRFADILKRRKTDN
jgi:hypothetical protein